MPNYSNISSTYLSRIGLGLGIRLKVSFYQSFSQPTRTAITSRRRYRLYLLTGSNRTTAFPFGSPQVKLSSVVLTILTTDDCLLLPFRLLLLHLPFCPLLCLLVRSLLCYCGLLVLRKLVGARLLLQIQCHTGLDEPPSPHPMICSVTIDDFATAFQLF